MYREPGLLLKSATTVDVLSGGRTYLGMGAGWYEREARGLGLNFPPRRERFERLEETLRLAHHAWRDDHSPFEGATIGSPSPSSGRSRWPRRIRRSWSAATGSDARCASWRRLQPARPAA